MTRRISPHHRGIFRTPLICLLALGTAGVGMAAEADLDQILANFDRVQGSVQTLSAEFTETTSNALLVEPMISEGQFFMTKPDSIRWEYSRPEPMRFVISQDQYTGYFPERKRAEKRNIRRWSDRIFRFIGLGQASTELRKLYNIRLEEVADSADGTYLLVFDPKKRRVRNRIDEVRFWIDATTYLPTRIEYLSANGHSRVIEFSEIQLNPDLSAGLYQVELPPDVTVTKGFGGLPGLEEPEYEASAN